MEPSLHIGKGKMQECAMSRSFEDFIQVGRVWSKMPRYQEKKKKALDTIAGALEKSRAPYLSMSGGKDSVAMAFLVRDAAKAVGKDSTIRMWAHISDASFPGTIETCRAVESRTGFPLDVYESDGSAFEALKNKRKQSFGKTGAFFDSIREYAKDKDLAFVGVRATESKRRMQAAKVHGQCFFSASMGSVQVCHPILWFTLKDIAAALYEYDAPIHPIYKKAPIGEYINRFHEDSFIRLSYITSRDLLNKGTAVFLKYNYPEQFYKLAEVWPEIRRYV